MAQHDGVIDNQVFPSTRRDINDLAAALSSTNAGTTRPSNVVVDGGLWIDRSNSTDYKLKFYDASAGTDTTLISWNPVTNAVSVAVGGAPFSLDWGDLS